MHALQKCSGLSFAHLANSRDARCLDGIRSDEIRSYEHGAADAERRARPRLPAPLQNPQALPPVTKPSNPSSSHSPATVNFEIYLANPVLQTLSLTGTLILAIGLTHTSINRRLNLLTRFAQKFLYNHPELATG